MFDNPEKLFILLVIALLIFGPSKLAGLGGTIGKTIRDFRSAVRGAQDTFGSELHQASAEFQPAQPALPAPDPLSSPPSAPAADGGTPGWSDPAAGAHPDQSSLASEPTAEALRKSLSGPGSLR